MTTLLDRILPSDIKTDPFVHVVKAEPIPPALAEELLAQFPTLEHLANGRTYGNNEKIRYYAKDVLTDQALAPVWQDFIKAHLSKEFFQKYIALFGPYIVRTYPHLRAWVDQADSLRIGVRKVDDPAECDVILDAEICADTPVTEPSSVKSVHIDNEHKLTVGMYYLRRDEDDSRGGNLETYRYSGPTRRLYGARMVPSEIVSKVSEVPYGKNVLFMFMNSMEALHGVSVREKTPHPRLAVNIVVELPKPLFTTSRYYGSFFEKVLRYIKRSLA